MDRDFLHVLDIKFQTKWTERDGITAVNEYLATTVVQEWSAVRMNVIS